MHHETILEKLKPYLPQQDWNYLNFHQDRFNYILEKLKTLHAEGKSFLEIGSLTGYLLMGATLIGYNVSGSDLPKYTEAIQSLSEAYHFDNRPADLSRDNIPFADNSFAVIVCSEVLEHFNFHPQKFFNEAARVLKPGGTLIVTTPNLNRLNNVIKLILGQSINAEINEPYTEGTHYREYNAAELKYMAEKSGLKIQNIEYNSFDYPNIDFKGKISDGLANLLWPSRKRDVCLTAIK